MNFIKCTYPIIFYLSIGIIVKINIDYFFIDSTYKAIHVLKSGIPNPKKIKYLIFF